MGKDFGSEALATPTHTKERTKTIKNGATVYSNGPQAIPTKETMKQTLETAMETCTG